MLAPRTCVLLVSLLPWAALAQPQVTLNVNGLDAGFANASECGVSEVVRYSVTAVATPCSDFRVWITAGSGCANAADAGDVEVGTVASASLASQPTGNLTFQVSSLPALDGGCGSIEEKTFRICGSYQYNNGVTGCTTDAPFSSLTSGPTFRYDAVPPSAPTITDITPLDHGLTVQLGLSGDTNSVDVQLRTQADGGPELDWGAERTFAVGEPVRLENLTNGVTYDVRARAADGAQNRSEFSEAASGTPEELFGFWDRYRSAGGADTGGCSQVGGGGLWLMALFPAFLAFWRRLR